MADSDMLALINSGGEPTVDALLYLIPHKGQTPTSMLHNLWLSLCRSQTGRC